MTATVTDRALRYRAVNLIPDHPKVCAFCGQRQKLMVGHVDGFEENIEPDNLTWTCRSCNAIASNTLQNAGLGRRTKQFNPTKSGGAANLGEWVQAVGVITPHKGAKYAGYNYGLTSDMKVSDAVAIIRATPHHKRSEFADKLRKKAGKRAEDRWNPAKKENLFGFGKQLSARQTTPARGGIAAHTGSKAAKPRPSSPLVAGSYGGYAIMKTPEGEFYSSLDRESLFETKRQVQQFIDWYKKGRGNPAKFDRCVKKVKAKGGAANAFAVCKSALKKKRKNPADAAVEAFEEFHGHPPDEIVEVKQRVHFHEHLAGAGTLKRLDVKGIDRQHHIIQGFRGALLAFNEQKNQLFIKGGDQSINLEDFGILKPHELETLGKVKHIDYHTRKDHLGDEGGDAVYTHQFRTTNENGEHVVVTIARYPDLIYRVRDQQLEFSGGSYEIRAEGIDK